MSVYEGNGRVDPARRASVAEALRAVLSADSVLDAEESVAPYECDGLNLDRKSTRLNSSH